MGTFVSFTKYQKYNQCPAQYKAEYIQPIQDDDNVEYIDSTFAAIGTYIQLLFEVVITKNLLCKSYSSFFLNNEVQKSLYNDLCKVVELEVFHLRRLPHSDETQAKLSEKVNQKLKYLKATGKTFYSNKKLGHDSLRLFAREIFNIFMANLKKFSTLNYYNCVCEKKVFRTLPDSDISLLGYCDFVFTNPKTNQITILDGKLNKNLDTASPEQMIFYAWGLGLENHEVEVGFWNYTTKQMRMWQLDREQILGVPSILSSFVDSLHKSTSKDDFKETPCKYGEVAGYCRYCERQNACKAVKAKKDLDFDEVSSKLDISDFI